jgi:hypothetical protein
MRAGRERGESEGCLMQESIALGCEARCSASKQSF